MTDTDTTNRPAGHAAHQRKPASFRTRLAVTVGLLLLGMLLAVILVQNISLDWAFQHQVDTISAGNGRTVGNGSSVASDAVSGTADSCDADSCDAAGSVSGQAGVQSGTEGVVLTVRDGVVQWMRYGSLAVFAIAALLAVMLVWRMSGRLTSRLDSISRQAAQLDPDHPSGRITLDHPDAETASLANALNAMLDRIEQSNQLQRSFIRNASHELKTPVTTIGTSLEALMAQNRFPEDVKPAIRHAIEANRKSGELINSLLELSRIQTAPDTGREATEPARIVRDALETHREQAQSRHLNINVDGLDAYRGATVETNPRYLSLTVDNLVRNAIIHNIDHGAIACTVHSDGRRVIIDIINTTKQPIDPTDTADLMQPFHRGDATRMANQPGHGLGLSIAKACTDAIGATLDVSRPTPTTFRARISLMQRQADNEHITGGSPDSDTPASVARSKDTPGVLQGYRSTVQRLSACRGKPLRP
ncbi:HAMP domain-containing sensor histidine kinase [Bifidobacterium leontopitheci]|uniref:histidine kinase n=1 Tax=Bifidobacterium leontopitheci TaxID=2650774 RepID=A0A6I1GMA0_9BIFI|nr:HAMP domain-containing sensor histidine kinase [Bifidobacterium leontopitheci]KAB7790726.1 Integral membrane sensor signal transduction histidine kinase [Bifidobacterium leontopitheci]